MLTQAFIINISSLSVKPFSSHHLREPSSTQRTSLRAWCECRTFSEKTPASVHTLMQPPLGNQSICCLKVQLLRTTTGFPKAGGSSRKEQFQPTKQKAVFCPEGRLQFLVHCLHVPHITAVYSTARSECCFPEEDVPPQCSIAPIQTQWHFSSLKVLQFFSSILVALNLSTQETWPLWESAFISESTLGHPSPSKASSSFVSAAYSADCTAKQHSWKMKQWHSHQGKVKSPETQASEINSSRPILSAEDFLQAGNKWMTDIFMSQIYPDSILSLSFTNHCTEVEQSPEASL